MLQFPLTALTIAVALAGTYVSLHAGLYPLLAMVNLLLWMLVAGFGLQVSLQSKTPWWQLVPVLVLLSSYAYHAYAFRMLREQYIEKHGYPRRYFSLEPEE
jgi:hypothetical protein